MSREAALFYKKLGISVIPTTAKKVPSVPKTVDEAKSWKPFQSRIFDDKEVHMFDNPGIAAVGGKISGNLECIDLDVKYDKHKCCDDFLSFALDFNPELVVAETPSGGYHIIYRCTDPVAGNKKIAGRHATEEEFKQVNKEIEEYNANIDAGKPEFAGKKKQNLKNKPEDIEIFFIETRGEGGYFLLYPSQGYSFVNGDIQKIPVLSADDRQYLIDLASSYNRIVEEHRVHIPATNNADWSVTPFDDYNNKANVRELLERHGWTFVYTRGQKDFYRRPGSENVQSGNWDHARKWFTVFSTNCHPFQVGKAYGACYVYAALEHNNDYKAAAKELLAKGFGTSTKKEIKPAHNPHELIANFDDIWKFNAKVDKGEIPMGLPTGWPEFDMYFKFKLKNFMIINGHPNVGKTLISVFLALISAMRHDWVWMIATTEDDAEWISRDLVEMVLGRKREESHPDNIKHAELFIEEHFIIIRASDFDFTHQELIDFASNYYNTVKKFQGFLVDPYSALVVPDNIVNTHKYNYRAASAFRRMAKDFGIAMWLTAHSVTEAQRKEEPKTGYQIAPKASDTEGGGLFANRADDFMTVHRIINHPDEWMNTFIHMRKVKVRRTGGKPTPIKNPFVARFLFTHFVDDMNKINPLYFDYAGYQSPFS